MVEDPPEDDSVVGLALTLRLPTAAVPKAIFKALAAATTAPPDDAVMVAVPFAPLALNVAIALPLMSVSVSDGSIVPKDVVKMTCVPECGGVPADSRTCAISCVVPVDDKAVAEAVNVIVDPAGASSGTRSQAATPASATRTAQA